MLAGFAIWTLVASLVTGSLYAWDKRASIKDHARVRERTLLTWSALGGWPGGLIASRWLRHKTQKLSYRMRFVSCTVLNITVVGGILAWSYW